MRSYYGERVSLMAIVSVHPEALHPQSKYGFKQEPILIYGWMFGRVSRKHCTSLPIPSDFWLSRLDSSERVVKEAVKNIQPRLHVFTEVEPFFTAVPDLRLEVQILWLEN